MPSILQYQQRTSPQASYATPRAAALNTQGVDVAGLADAFTGMLENQRKRQEEEGRAWAIEAVSDARLQWTSRLMDNQATADFGAPDFTQNFVKEFDAYSAEAIKNAPNPAAQKHLRERLADIRTTLGERAITFEAGARIDLRDTKFNAAIDNTQKLMNADPGQFEVGLAELLTVIDSSELPPAKRADMRQKAIGKVADAAVWSQINRSPERFLESIGGDGPLRGATGNKPFDVLPFEQRTQMLSKAISEKNFRAGEANRDREQRRLEIMQPLYTVVGDALRSGASIGAKDRDAVLGPLRGADPKMYADAAKEIDRHNDEIRTEARAAAAHFRAMATTDATPAKLRGLSMKYDMLNNPDRFANVDMKAALFPLVQEGKLKIGDAEELINLQATLRKPGPEMVTLLTGNQYLDVRLEGVTVDGTKFSNMSKTKQQEIRTRALMVAEPLLKNLQAGGTKASTEDVKKVVDSMFTTSTFRRTFLGIPGSRKTETKIDEVGAATRLERARVEKVLRDAGYNPTPALIDKHMKPQ